MLGERHLKNVQARAWRSQRALGQGAFMTLRNTPSYLL